MNYALDLLIRAKPSAVCKVISLPSAQTAVTHLLPPRGAAGRQPAPHLLHCPAELHPGDRQRKHRTSSAWEHLPVSLLQPGSSIKAARPNTQSAKGFSELPQGTHILIQAIHLFPEHVAEMPDPKFSCLVSSQK